MVARCLLVMAESRTFSFKRKHKYGYKVNGFFRTCTYIIMYVYRGASILQRLEIVPDGSGSLLLFLLRRNPFSFCDYSGHAFGTLPRTSWRIISTAVSRTKKGFRGGANVGGDAVARTSVRCDGGGCEDMPCGNFSTVDLVILMKNYFVSYLRIIRRQTFRRPLCLFLAPFSRYRFSRGPRCGRHAEIR